MGWCDDTKSKKYYNKKIKIPKNIRHERIYRKDTIYDLLIPIKYNFTKPRLVREVQYFYMLQKIIDLQKGV